MPSRSRVNRVTKAVVPAAGYGTRMRPMTLGVPKELFPLGDSPLIAHAVRDATAAGIREICVVPRARKEAPFGAGNLDHATQDQRTVRR